jgi:hypothetical protein
MQNLGGGAPVVAARVALGGIEKRLGANTDFFCAGDKKVCACDAGALAKHSKCHNFPSSSKKPIVLPMTMP